MDDGTKKTTGNVARIDGGDVDEATAELQHDLALAGADERKLEELRQQHGEIHVVKVTPKSADPVVVLVKRPGRVEWRKLQSDNMDAGKKALASEGWVRACVIWPGREAFDELLKKYPALVRPISDELLSIAGLEDGSSRKV